MMPPPMRHYGYSQPLPPPAQQPPRDKPAGPWGWALVIVAAFALGMVVGTVSPTPPLGATTTVVEATLTPTPTASPTSRNVQILKLAWGKMPENEKTDLREGWRMAKAQGAEQLVIDLAMQRLTSPYLKNLTEAEVREFLDWTLEN